MSRDNDIDNLRNRIAAARKSPSYSERCMVDVPTHVLERLLDALTAAEAKADKWAEEAASLGTKLFKTEAERDASLAREYDTGIDFETYEGRIEEELRTVKKERDAAVARAERMRVALFEIAHAVNADLGWPQDFVERTAVAALAVDDGHVEPSAR
jgi:hypothetical protein